MSNLCAFKEALQHKLAEDMYLVEALEDDAIDIRTGVRNITIAEIAPNTRDQVPFLGFSVPSTKPIAEDDLSGCYISEVYFHIVTASSFKTTYIADRVQFLIAQKPVGASYKWFFDLDDDCIVSKNSKFLNRFPLAPRRFEPDADVFTDIIQARFIWCFCPCMSITCESETPEDCPLLIEEFEIDCECDE